MPVWPLYFPEEDELKGRIVANKPKELRLTATQTGKLAREFAGAYMGTQGLLAHATVFVDHKYKLKDLSMRDELLETIKDLMLVCADKNVELVFP